MEGILINWVEIIPNITKTIKDMISYFWQPSMDSRKYYYNNKQHTRNESTKKEIDKKEHLSLDTIMVLRIDGIYMVTMKGLKQSNCEDRILLSNGQKEKTIIEKYLQYDIELERKSIINSMNGFLHVKDIGENQYQLFILKMEWKY